MVRVRFAPSPTGALHLGNIRTALFNFLFARRQGGVFILRIEDTDVERVKPESVEEMLEDLEWLGLGWDEGPRKEGACGPYIQSQRLHFYEEALKRLIRQGQAYPCYCTEAELEERRRQAAQRKLPPRYDNRCRTLTHEELSRRERQGIRPAMRFRIDQPVVHIHDWVKGDVRFDLDQMMGDFVIVRPDGRPTFHLAVCVDDGLMGITHVIRGDDHLSNTPRHVLLFHALGFPIPAFAHMPLTLAPGGEPLSKRAGAVTIAEYRRAGFVQEALLNAMALLGWSPGDDREVFTLPELVSAFSLDHVTVSSATFSADKLKWLGGLHMRRLSDDVFVERALAFLKAGTGAPLREGRWPEARLAKAVLLFKDTISSFGELSAQLGALESPQQQVLRRELDARAFPHARSVLTEALSAIGSVSEGARSPWGEDFLTRLGGASTAKGKNLYMPLRLALTGSSHGPELKRLLDCLGVDDVRERLERASQVLSS